MSDFERDIEAGVELAKLDLERSQSLNAVVQFVAGFPPNLKNINAVRDCFMTSMLAMVRAKDEGRIVIDDDEASAMFTALLGLAFLAGREEIEFEIARVQ